MSLSQRPRISLTDYVTYRLGRAPSRQLYNLFVRPFRAASLAEFWQRWNPMWSYYLYFFCYQPLRRWLPRPYSVLLTFTLCGLAHCALVLPLCLILSKTPLVLLPTVLLFFFIGVTVTLSEQLHLQWARIPAAWRWPLHVGCLLLCYKLAEYSSKLI